MRYYVHYSDYCPHVYHTVSAVEGFSLIQMVGISNFTLYFACRGRVFKFHEPCLMDVNYCLLIFPLESSPLSSLGIKLTLFAYVTGSNQRLYPLYDVSLTTSVYEFLGIINLMSSATTVGPG